MGLTLARKDFIAHLEGMSLEEHGDPVERKVSICHPACRKAIEGFWRVGVVLCTDRVGRTETCRPVTGKFRDDVDDRVTAVCWANYSVVHQLMLVEQRLADRPIGWSEDAFTHLCSACEQIREFLRKVYEVWLSCTGQSSSLLAKYSTLDQFKAVAEEKLAANMDKMYSDFRTKGDAARLFLIHPDEVTSEFFTAVGAVGRLQAVKDFQLLWGEMREFRNAMVHRGVQLSLVLEDSRYLPKYRCLRKYRTMRDYQSLENQDVESDFIEEECLVTSYIVKLRQSIADLWPVPTTTIADLIGLESGNFNPVASRLYAAQWSFGNATEADGGGPIEGFITSGDPIQVSGSTYPSGAARVQSSASVGGSSSKAGPGWVPLFPCKDEDN